MSTKSLKSLSVTELVDKFTEVTLRQYQASMYGESAKYNILFDEMHRVGDELKSRHGDQRSALVPLLVHPNPQVRLMAAELTLVVAPVASRQALQDLADAKIYPQSANAMGTLRALARGDRRPS